MHASIVLDVENVDATLGSGGADMAKDPLRIERIGVDAACFDGSANAKAWSWLHPSNGLRVGAARYVSYEEGLVEPAFGWVVSFGWKDIVIRGEESDDLDDAFDAAMEHAHTFVPKLWSVVYDLVEAEKARRQNELARMDREAEGSDEENQA
jgi:hypothetical protein